MSSGTTTAKTSRTSTRENIPATLDSRESSKEWAAYLQDEFRIHPKLILNAGVRYDHYSTFGGTTNPRLGLIWMPRESTAAKLLYGRAFRAPNSFEMYFGNVGGIKANPDLRPEVIHSYEAVLEQHANGGAPTGSSRRPHT